MSNESPSLLPADIIQSADRIIRLIGQQKGELVALRESRTHDEAVRNYTAAMGTQCCITAEAQQLKAWVAAAQMTGLVAKREVRAEALELHPINYHHRHGELALDGKSRAAGERTEEDE